MLGRNDTRASTIQALPFGWVLAGCYLAEAQSCTLTGQRCSDKAWKGMQLSESSERRHMTKQGELIQRKVT